MKQSSIEWVVDQLIEKDLLMIYGKPLEDNDLIEILNQAKAMEKEQIEEAFINGHKDGWNFGKGGTQQFFLSTIYYNETYGGNK